MTHNSAVSPYAFDGGSIGVLLCHGFTGSPAAMRPWAEYMARHGFSVRLPLLPGHGTTPQEMARTSWRDWYEEEAAAFRELRSRCDHVFVFGLSMGGTLAIRLAEELGDEVDGLVLVNAAVHTENPLARFARVIQYVKPMFPAIKDDIKKPGAIEGAYDRMPVRSFVQLQELWGAVRRDIDRVTQPTLMVTSSEDHLVEPSNARWLRERLASRELRELVLENSYHVATVDYDAELLFARSLDFTQSVVQARS